MESERQWLFHYENEEKPKEVTATFLPRNERVINTTGQTFEELRFIDAVKHGDLEKVKMLGKSDKIDFNFLDQSGTTCLGFSAQQGNSDMVSVLLKMGFDPNQSDFYGQTAVQLASEHGHIDVIKFLIEAKANLNWMDVNNDGLSAIHIAACKGQTEVVQLLIDSGCDVNVTDLNGVSVLHCAVANGHQEIVSNLLKAGAGINIKGSVTERTPLFLAAEVGDIEMIQLLMQNGARINLTDNYEMTPLVIACIQDKTDVGLLFLNNVSKVNKADHKANLPIHYTARNGNMILTRKLIEAGSKINAVNKYGEGPLHLAVRNGHLEMVTLLVHEGCDVNLGESMANHISPLQMAVCTYSEANLFEKVLEVLIEGGCNLDSVCGSQETALFNAIDIDKTDIALTLIQHGADIGAVSIHDITVFQLACQKNYEEIIETMLYSGLNLANEIWLQTDKYSSGINPKLLVEVQEDIPMTLIGKIDLFFFIEEIRCSPLSLMRLSRKVIRHCVGDKIGMKIRDLLLPARLSSFLMLKIV